MNQPDHSPDHSILLDEIHEQPAALRRALAGGKPGVGEVVAHARRRDIRYLVLAARGTSDNAAVYAKYLFQIVCGLPVALAAPSVHTLWQAEVRYQNALVIGVSQSGAGEDINEVVAQARRGGAMTVAITNTPGSPLAGIAEFVLPCGAGVERAVAATKTYTTTLALFALFAAAWAQNSTFSDGLGEIPGRMEEALAAVNNPARQVAQTLIHAERFLTVARGLHLATAIEAALKIAETTGTPTQAFSSADLLHGPIASVAVRTPCLLFIPDGETAAVMAAVADKLASRGARVLRLSTPTAPTPPDIPLTAPATELLAPLLDIVPAQLLAYHLTVARGLDPDHPQGLSKVTITR